MKSRKVMDQRKCASSKFVEVEDCDHPPLDRYQDLDQGCPLSIIPTACNGWLIEISKLLSNA
jgi:hypothetical protein